MSDGNGIKFMASPLWACMYGVTGVMSLFNSILNFMMGRQVNSAMQLIISLLMCYVAYRYSTTPALEITDDYLEFIYRPISPKKKILLTDVIDLERSGKKRKIVLANRDTYAIPYRFLKKSERENALDIIKSKIAY
ncbi:hypothetical protein GMSM_46130 [Geomonas sp. Red276]